MTCITGGIYPDRAAKQQTPAMQVILVSFLKKNALYCETTVHDGTCFRQIGARVYALEKPLLAFLDNLRAPSADIKPWRTVFAKNHRYTPV